ncbi:hypothetical protein DFH07DRAFT_857944 [Mycena maculata]|uniref:Uncharacterized protein n=1 Tax=Mycena maculata TaxID=230809 RepID=A0AAD7HIA0_9AGAR|nr:hypothetical protein DFH07DRAFT_857944 [Mycena maculata]
MGVLCPEDQGISVVTSQDGHVWGPTPPTIDRQVHCGSCIFCTYRPPIPPSHPAIAMISDLFKDNASGEYADVFQTLGITHDTHLRILLGMEEGDIRRFFAACVPNKLTPIGFAEVLELLQKFYEAHKWVALPLTSIPRKKNGDTFEVFLSKRDTSSKIVAQSMRFSEEEYGILAAQIRPQIAWYLDIDCTLNEQDPRQVERFVQAMCDQLPVFTRYERAWPIEVFLRRLLPLSREDLVGCPSPDTLLPRMYQRQHRCPRLTQYFRCDGPKSVAPAARKLLSIFRMDEELAPALHFLGVNTDAAFEELRHMSLERKTDFVEEANELELNAFQKLILNRLFER